MSIHVLSFAEIIIHRLALSLAAGAASPAFSWDNFPRMAVAHVKTQWVVAQGRSEEDLALHVFEVAAIAKAVARDHAKAKLQTRESAVMSTRTRKVFLGGSCGDSDWRQKIARPLLDAAGIPYFDPVVPDWKPECIAIEAREKVEAEYILFAIEGGTRGIISLTEAVEMAATGRRLFLVIQDVPPEASLGRAADQLRECAVTAQGALAESIKAYTANERKDLNRGRAYVRDTARRHGVTLFDTIEEAVRALIADAARETP